MAYERTPRGATEDARIKDAVSRMAAVLVLAAGGEIRVPHHMMRDADFIELYQSDRESGVTIYRASPHRRVAAGPIVEGQVVDARPARVLPGLPHDGEQ